MSFRLLLATSFCLSLLVACSDEPAAVVQQNEDCFPVKSASAGQVVEGQYIVSFAPTVSKSTGKANARAAATSILSKHKLSEGRIKSHIEGAMDRYVLKLSHAEALELQQDDEIAIVEHDRYVSICACLTVVEPRLLTWNVSNTGYGDGRGKTAWLLDTGIDFDHKDLTVDTKRSKSFIDGVTSAKDDNGHGTHVAGVIGAKNNNFGTLGVASGATLVAIKVLDNKGEGTLSALLSGLAYVRQNAAAGEVVNISLGLDDVSATLENEIQALASRNIFVTMAAGNDSKKANEFSPARINGKNIFTISAVDSLNRFAEFSNFGMDVVDYAAPGVRVLSTYFQNQYAKMSGTSMAAPHVAGLLLINGKVNSRKTTTDPAGDQLPVAFF